ncbi:hypothetical protein [Roseateles sp.]|uniref:hypothetical protein n=1 Tax=Roseateles sp. TaxID=1971397 RepID=UPI003D0C781D
MSSTPASSPALPQRRRFLKLGLGATVLLAVAGAGTALLSKPGLVEGRLSAPARQLMRAITLAVCGDLLPPEGPAREARLTSHLEQVDRQIAGFPPALRAELGQLLTLLGTAPGRIGLMGLRSPWAEASPAEVQARLQSMGRSGLGLRQQVFHALRDLNCLVFFNDPASWPLVGYPGPRTS